MTALVDLVSQITPGELQGSFDPSVNPFVVSGVTTRVRANEWVEGREEIEVGGERHAFDTRYMLVNPRLSSVSFRHTRARTGDRKDFNATVVTGRKLEILDPGDGQYKDVTSLCLAAIRAQNPGINASDEALLRLLASYGFEPHGELPMYLQHLGSSEEAFNAIVEEFVALGAQPGDVNSAENKVSVRGFYRMGGEGLSIEALELGMADRSAATVNPNAGYIGALDATWQTFLEIMRIHRTRSILKQVLENNASESDEAQQAKLMEDGYHTLFSSSRRRRPFRNWGGTTKVFDELDDTKVNYYSQQVPCGRMTVSTPTGPSTWDVWTTRPDRNNGTQDTTDQQASVAGFTSLFGDDEAAADS